ncbi:MAG: FG-GAP-like repeat-containing protein, partial [bacterium]|nr:FG-GAP-like repeat-containing protein [bacterium]
MNKLFVSRSWIGKSVVWVIVFSFIITPLYGLQAQETPLAPPVSTIGESEAQTPADSGDATIPEESLEDPATPENSTADQKDKKEKEGVEKESKKEEKKDDKKPIEEEPAPEAQSLRSVGGGEASSLKFELPTQSKASVDQSTGALTYAYPIDLPEGRNKLTPNLALSYNSRNASRPDSIAGLGWDISIPYIQREPVKGTQNLYAKAYFSSSISGNLIATTDTSSSQYAVYRPESDDGSYLKYVFNSDNSWTMTGKDGLTYTFGAAASSRQDNPSDITKIYKWMVTSIADAHGNSIQFTYTKNSGQIYPNQITYAHHVSAPATHTITFGYTPPVSYGSTVYNSGFAVTTTKLLGTITVSSTVDGQTGFQTYTLTHGNSQFLKQKLLSNIKRTASLPEVGNTDNYNDITTFNYSAKTPGWEQGTHSLNGILTNTDGITIYKDIYTADFDLNGYPDVLISNFQNNQLYNRLALNTGTTFSDVTSSWSLPNHDISDSNAIADVNGDRLPDLVPRYYDASASPPVYLNTGSGFTGDNSGTWFIRNYLPEVVNCGPNVGDAMSYNTNTFLHDINFDGKNDIVYFGGDSGFKVMLNNGNGWTASSNYTFAGKPGSNYSYSDHCGVGPNGDNYQALIDMNGDGLEDYVHQRFGTYLNTKAGWAYSAAYTVKMINPSVSGFADINNDGLLDYVAYDSSVCNCTNTHVNNGSGFTVYNSGLGVWAAADLNYTSTNSSVWGSLIDVTADGYPDIVGSYTNAMQGKVRSINDSLKTWVGNSNTNDQWYPLIAPRYGVYFDVNTDGVIDYITPNATWNNGPNENSRVHIGKAAVPNRLTKITNVLRAETAIEYSTAPTNLDDTDAAPIPVVKKITIQNIGQNQPSMVTQYAYQGGAYVVDAATGQKRFTGFHKVTKTESGGDLNPLRVLDTYFHQANGSNSATNEPVDISFAQIGKPYYSITKHPSSTPKKEIWHKYGTHMLVTEPVIGRVAKFVYPIETVTKSTDTSGSVGTAELYIFDTTLGEQTELRNMGFVTVGSNGSYTDSASDTRYQFTEYATDSGSTLVKLKRMDLRTSSASGDTLARTDYFYDGQAHGTVGTYGDLTKETKWISGNGMAVADTSYTYDLWGNVSTVTNPRNAITTYTYDSSKTYVATETNHLNQATTYLYSVGRLKQATDPNGRIITYGYSSLGNLYSTT